MLFQNSFEWLVEIPASTELTSTNINYNNNICYDTNTNLLDISNLNTDISEFNTLLDPINFEFDYDIGSQAAIQNFNNLSSVSLNTVKAKNETEGLYDLKLDNSLKNVLDEIESISCAFLGDASQSSSENSMFDQEISSSSLGSLSPLPELIDFNVPDISDSQMNSPVLSSAGESEKPIENLSNKRVKSGRVNKRESNKVAAVRYRAKKKP